MEPPIEEQPDGHASESSPVPVIPIPDDPGEPEYATPPDDDDGPGVGDEYPDEPHDV